MFSQNQQRQAAFSLWEVLIALAISSFILLSISAWQLRALLVVEQENRQAINLVKTLESIDGMKKLVYE
ncbi:MAG: hypothetical protein CMF39_03530 [Legionellaceae bacterium]|nr:hypothetical protein [Legionellaceae bacterium]|tara:strand:+ start:163 stop:369 length:207 start_codon:yes stop_codon:yes gene_type:complete